MPLLNRKSNDLKISSFIEDTNLFFHQNVNYSNAIVEPKGT
jgi:hypothetical protein